MLFGIIYQPLELKLTTSKSRFFMQKSMNKYFSTRTQLWKSLEKTLDPQKCQNADVNLAKSVNFWFHLQSTSSTFILLTFQKG